MSEQDDVAEALETWRSDNAMPWAIETDSINDGRPAVRVSWAADVDLPHLAVDEDRLPHGWGIVQFGVGASRDIGAADHDRYLTLAPQEDG